jgi:hypothetical protein
VCALPVVLTVLLHFRLAEPALTFFVALGLMAIIGFSSTASMAVNAFGCDGAGFRRYFLAPIRASAVLRVANMVPLCLGALLIPMVLLVCRAVFRIPIAGIMMMMLASASLGGLFLLHAIAIWTGLLDPSKSDSRAWLSNKDLSPTSCAWLGSLMPHSTSFGKRKGRCRFATPALQCQCPAGRNFRILRLGNHKDCVDFRNRPTHRFERSDRALDEATTQRHQSGNALY